MTKTINNSDIDSLDVAKGLVTFGSALFFFGFGRWLNDRKKRGEEIDKLKTEMLLLKEKVTLINEKTNSIKKELEKMDLDLERIRATNHELVVAVNLICSKLQIDHKINIMRECRI